MKVYARDMVINSSDGMEPFTHFKSSIFSFIKRKYNRALTEFEL